MLWQEYVARQSQSISQLPEAKLQTFIEGLLDVQHNDGVLWVGGNGGSHATASHAVADLTKTVTAGGKRPLRTIALSEATSLTTAFSNDESFETSLAESLRRLARPGDAVLIISVSGQSPNLMKLIEMAQKLKIKTFAMVGKKGSALEDELDFCLLVDDDDYQIVENTHLVLLHWIVKKLS